MHSPTRTQSFSKESLGLFVGGDVVLAGSLSVTGVNSRGAPEGRVVTGSGRGIFLLFGELVDVTARRGGRAGFTAGCGSCGVVVAGFYVNKTIVK